MAYYTIINMTWWDEQHTTLRKSALSAKESIYAEKLLAKYGIKMSDMVKAIFDNVTQQWVPQPKNATQKSFTDDGCSHYIFEGKHYKLSYLFHDDEWFYIKE